jgi:hypothetical protein
MTGTSFYVSLATIIPKRKARFTSYVICYSLKNDCQLPG